MNQWTNLNKQSILFLSAYYHLQQHVLKGLMFVFQADLETDEVYTERILLHLLFSSWKRSFGIEEEQYVNKKNRPPYFISFRTLQFFNWRQLKQIPLSILVSLWPWLDYSNSSRDFSFCDFFRDEWQTVITVEKQRQWKCKCILLLGNWNVEYSWYTANSDTLTELCTLNFNNKLCTLLLPHWIVFLDP